ncbi:MAG: NHL repeat-containing protein [Acetobacteraceae bacterium]
MATALRVNLTPALKHAPIPSRIAVLDREGPFACLGLSAGADGLAIPVAPGATSLFGPRGVSLMGPGGPLWVSDTGHHRLLGWARMPDADNAPADWVIGQPDFSQEGRNAKGQPGPATLNVPCGVTPLGNGIAVADAWNHRVLIWHERPEQNHAPADVVLGQSDFASVEANGGHATASAQSLFWPYGVHWDGVRLWVADTGNRRVLMWHGAPMRNGQAADLVLGQHDFGTRDENGGGEPSLSSMRWPHDVAVWDGSLCVTDAGNNRIMIWDVLPTRNDQACDRLLGQADPTQVDHNQSLYWPSACTLHMPYGIASSGKWLVAADTANSRLLGWHANDHAYQAGACALTGQDDFHAKGDNRWALPSRDSLCWPYGIAVCGDVAAVADSGNNRVLLWRLAPDLIAS